MGQCWDQSPWGQDSCVEFCRCEDRCLRCFAKNCAGFRPQCPVAWFRTAAHDAKHEKCWALLLATLNTWQRIWRECDGNMQGCWKLSHLCPMFNVHGPPASLRIGQSELLVACGQSCARDQNMWTCLCGILRIPVDSCEEQTRSTATLLLSLGGLGRPHIGPVGQMHFQ